MAEGVFNTTAAFIRLTWPPLQQRNPLDPFSLRKLSW